MRQILRSSFNHLFIHPFYRQFRGMTLGTRIIVQSPEKQVLLVRHSYVRGWSLPGGGVERGESLQQAATRELREEAGIITEGPLELRGICLNDAQFAGDHVAIFMCRYFSREQWKAGWEIREAHFFPLNQLPEHTTAGTRRRLEELEQGKAPSALW